RRHTRFSRDWSSDVCSSDLSTTSPAASAAWFPPACARAARNCRRTSRRCCSRAWPSSTWSPARSSRCSARCCCAPARSSNSCRPWSPTSRRGRRPRPVRRPAPRPTEPATMGLALVHGRARAGVRAPAVKGEAHLGGGLPSMSIVRLPEAAVREAKDRVRAAIQCAQFEFPARRITVNLAPADLPKCGGRFDLPIALGILAASGQVPGESLAGYEFIGELGLTGELRPVDGVLPAALAVARAGRRLVVPEANGPEAAL